MSYNSHITNLSLLTDITTLDLSYNSHITDLSVLTNLTKLTLTPPETYFDILYIKACYAGHVKAGYVSILNNNTRVNNINESVFVSLYGIDI